MLNSGRRIFICSFGRCINADVSRRSLERLESLVAEHGLDSYDSPNRVQCRLSGCLSICEDGPTMVIHPDRVWYHRVDEAAVERIFNEHILNNRIVEDLLHHREPGMGQNS